MRVVTRSAGLAAMGLSMMVVTSSCAPPDHPVRAVEPLPRAFLDYLGKL